MSRDSETQLDAPTHNVGVFLIMLSAKLCGWALAAFVIGFLVALGAGLALYAVLTWTQIHVTIATSVGSVIYKVVSYTPAHLIN